MNEVYFNSNLRIGDEFSICNGNEVFIYTEEIDKSLKLNNFKIVEHYFISSCDIKVKFIGIEDSQIVPGYLIRAHLTTYQYGDLVKVRNDLSQDICYGAGYDVSDDMLKLRGKYVKIIRVFHNETYKIEESKDIWAVSMFEGKVIENTTDFTSIGDQLGFQGNTSFLCLCPEFYNNKLDKYIILYYYGYDDTIKTHNNEPLSFKELCTVINNKSKIVEICYKKENVE